MSKVKKPEIFEKLNISVEEAVAYSGVGRNRIRELMKEPDCDFVLRVGERKSLIRREKFEEYLMPRMEI